MSKLWGDFELIEELITIPEIIKQAEAGRYDHEPHGYMEAMTCQNCHLLEVAIQWSRLFHILELEKDLKE